MATQSNRHRPSVPAHPTRLRERYDLMVQSAGARGRFIRTPQGGAVHVIEAGDGPPVVHLHGNNTSSLSHLMLLAPPTEVRSVLVDRPGFGLSDPVTLPRNTFRPCAVRFSPTSSTSSGWSRPCSPAPPGAGPGRSGAHSTARSESAAFVLRGSVPLLPGARIPIGIRLLATPVLGNVLSHAVRPGRRMLLRLMSSMGEGDTILRHPDLLDSLIDAASDPVATAANLAEFQALITPFGARSATRIRPDDLRRVAVPTLMICGDHDPVVSVADAQAAADLIPDARLAVLPAGHVPQLGNPERVAELLAQFARSS
jgi:pimeloyl-ACP methyl ester carboxylesterase